MAESVLDAYRIVRLQAFVKEGLAGVTVGGAFLLIHVGKTASLDFRRQHLVDAQKDLITAGRQTLVQPLVVCF